MVKVPIHQGTVVNQHADSSTTIALTNKANLMEAQSKQIKVTNAQQNQDINSKNVEKLQDITSGSKKLSEKPNEQTSKQKKDDFEAKLEQKFYGVFWLGEKKHLFSVTSCNCMG